MLSWVSVRCVSKRAELEDRDHDDSSVEGDDDGEIVTIEILADDPPSVVLRLVLCLASSPQCLLDVIARGGALLGLLVRVRCHEEASRFAGLVDCIERLPGSRPDLHVARLEVSSGPAQRPAYRATLVGRQIPQVFTTDNRLSAFRGVSEWDTEVEKAHRATLEKLVKVLRVRPDEIESY